MRSRMSFGKPRPRGEFNVRGDRQLRGEPAFVKRLVVHKPGPALPVAKVLGAAHQSPALRGERALSDLATTIEAEDAVDLARCAGPIQAPTLIVAGAKDRCYSPELFAETAALIPSSRLELVTGRGHITVLSAREYLSGVPRFLVAPG